MNCKTCTVCDTSRPTTEFYSCDDGVGGVRGKCKECEKRQARVRRQRNLHKAREYGRTYYAANRDVLLKAANDNISTPRGKIDNAVSCGVSRGIRRGSKNGRRSFDLLGYSLEGLMSHLESQFEPTMTWENYGFYGWHIDHKKPLASFNYETPDDPQFKQAWALSNLRPLWAEANWRKGYTDMPELYQDNAETENTESKSAA
jgi:hypothetical protein